MPQNGLFSIKLGEILPLNNQLFSVPLWLGVKVGGDSEMLPRSIILSSPYALKADDSDRLQDFAAAELDESGEVNSEASARTVGDSLLLSSLNAEVSNRSSADKLIDGTIDFFTAMISPLGSAIGDLEKRLQQKLTAY